MHVCCEHVIDIGAPALLLDCGFPEVLLSICGTPEPAPDFVLMPVTYLGEPVTHLGEPVLHPVAA